MNELDISKFIDEVNNLENQNNKNDEVFPSVIQTDNSSSNASRSYTPTEKLPYGFISLPGGMILQWKQINEFHKSNEEIFFTFSFPNSCLNIQATAMEKDKQITITDLDRRFFKIYKTNKNLLDDEVKGFVIAIGY